MDQQTLFPQDWVCLVNNRHPRIGRTLTLSAYKEEGHVAITRGTSTEVLDDSLKRHRIQRNVVLESPSFLGLGAIIGITDLIATLPRQIAETLGKSTSLRVVDCPFPVPTFDVKQHWNERFHHDAANRWLRGVAASLYMRR